MFGKQDQKLGVLLDALMTADKEHVHLVLSGLPRDLSWQILTQGEMEVVDLEAVDKSALPFTLTLPTVDQDSYVAANPYASMGGTWTGGWGEDAKKDKASYEDS